MLVKHILCTIYIFTLIPQKTTEEQVFIYNGEMGRLRTAVATSRRRTTVMNYDANKVRTKNIPADERQNRQQLHTLSQPTVPPLTMADPGAGGRGMIPPLITFVPSLPQIGPIKSN